MTETSTRVPAVSGDAAPPLPAQQLVTALTEALNRHREAILAGDSAAVARWTDELSWLLPGVQQAVQARAAEPDGAHPAGPSAVGPAAAARELREVVRTNLMLAHNGIVIAHQFVAAVAEASSLDDSALFAGVA